MQLKDITLTNVWPNDVIIEKYNLFRKLMEFYENCNKIRQSILVKINLQLLKLCYAFLSLLVLPEIVLNSKF